MVNEMKFLFSKRVLVFFILIGFISCAEDVDIDAISTKIEALPEYQIAEKRIDSLNKAGEKASMTAAIVSPEWFSEDASNSIYTYYLREDLESVKNTLYIIRFNAKTYKILSVEPNSKFIKNK